MDLITGIMVATNGMLSTTAEAMAETHRMTRAVTVRSASVKLITRSARILNVRASSIPYGDNHHHDGREPKGIKVAPETAVSWLRTPNMTIRPAPSQATIARLTFSETINA